MTRQIDANANDLKFVAIIVQNNALLHIPSAREAPKQVTVRTSGEDKALVKLENAVRAVGLITRAAG